jgi:hypothetical protein
MSSAVNSYGPRNTNRETTNRETTNHVADHGGRVTAFADCDLSQPARPRLLTTP